MRTSGKQQATRYVAFLRGVSPVNAKMADLRACFEAMFFTEVRTILSSGNVAFTTALTNESTLAKSIEAGMSKHLARSFPVIVRKSEYLQALMQTDPYSGFALSATAKRVVSFLSQPHEGTLFLPIEGEGARILSMADQEVFTEYVLSEQGPIFMALIEKTFGKNITTRTWKTVSKCAAA